LPRIGGKATPHKSLQGQEMKITINMEKKRFQDEQRCSVKEVDKFRNAEITIRIYLRIIQQRDLLLS